MIAIVHLVQGPDVGDWIFEVEGNQFVIPRDVGISFGLVLQEAWDALPDPSVCSKMALSQDLYEMLNERAAETKIDMILAILQLASFLHDTYGNPEGQDGTIHTVTASKIMAMLPELGVEDVNKGPQGFTEIEEPADERADREPGKE